MGRGLRRDEVNRWMERRLKTQKFVFGAEIPWWHIYNGWNIFGGDFLHSSYAALP